MESMRTCMVKAGLILVLVLALSGCVTSPDPLILDPVDQQVVVSDLTAACFNGDRQACRRLPEEKARLIRLLSQ